MATNTTLWRLENHTKGKHAVLKSYLDAWFPILSRYNGRILFIDGFAGPGKYKDGEDGSPLVALRCINEHTASQSFKEIICFFIEADKDRADHLRTIIRALEESGQIPKKCKVIIENGKFDETLTSALSGLEDKKEGIAPAFVMIDPFGLSDTPMSVIKRLFKNEKVEVYISLMYEHLNRFKSTHEFGPHLDNLFGTPGWRRALTIKDSEECRRYLFDLYEEQLKLAGATHVVRFELYSGNRLKYAIFFGSKSILGADKMKQSIWKIVPTGDYEFHGGREEQLTLSVTSVNYKPLKEAIQRFLTEKPPLEWVPVRVIEDYVITETDYHSSHYKKNVLREFEATGQIEVEPSSRKVKQTYPDGTLLRWKR